MKKYFLLLGILIFMPVLACQSENKADDNISYYTCPMHPEIHRDEPGNCPICGMTLVPVMKEPVSTQKNATSTGPSVTISSERQQLIGVKTAKAEKKDMETVIRTGGRVAYEWEPVPARGGAWIYATLYENELPTVTNGSVAEIQSGGKTFTGIVKQTSAIVEAQTRSGTAMIELTSVGANNHLPPRPGTYVDVTLKMKQGEALQVPRSALIDTGIRKVVFLAHGDHFEQRNVETGAVSDEFIEIVSGVNEGDLVVSSATFLVDAETQLKSSVSGDAAHQH